MKALYLSSGTTAEEVIGALLQKYGITDNPLKFALFEKQVREEGHSECLVASRQFLQLSLIEFYKLPGETDSHLENTWCVYLWSIDQAMNN